MMFQSYAIFPAHVGRAERGVRPAAGGRFQGRDRAPRRRNAGTGEARAVREAQAASAVRRPAPARRAGTFAGQEAEAAAAGRAAGGAGQEAARAHAVRIDQHAGDARRHLHRGDPRPGRGDDALEPHRPDGPRRHRAGGNAERDVRVPEFAFRRRVHRFGQHVRGTPDRGRAVLRAHRVRRPRSPDLRGPRREFRPGCDSVGRHQAGEDPGLAREAGQARTTGLPPWCATSRTWATCPSTC